MLGLLLAAAVFAAAEGASISGALAARKRSAPKKATAAKKPGELKAGQFEWHPARSPSGPLAIIVSLTKQRVYVYRNGIQIGVSTCSTGKKDYDTPTGAGYPGSLPACSAMPSQVSRCIIGIAALS